MSIWSKNHEELAKLAKTLQDRNVRTRRQLGKDGFKTWSSHRLAASRSKSDSNISSSVKCAKNEFRELSLAGGSEDDSSARLRIDSFSSGDSAISPDFTRGTVLSPTSILKPSSSVVRNGYDPGKMEALSSPRSLDKKVTFLLRAGSDDNMEHLMVNNRNGQLSGIRLLNGDNSIEKETVFAFESDSTDHNSLKKPQKFSDSSVNEQENITVPSGAWNDCSENGNDGAFRYLSGDVKETNGMNWSTESDEMRIVFPTPSGQYESGESLDANLDKRQLYRSDEHQTSKEAIPRVVVSIDKTMKDLSCVENVHFVNEQNVDRIQRSSPESLEYQNPLSNFSNEFGDNTALSDYDKSPHVPTQNMNDIEKVSCNSSTTLNISDDLNLLLISLLTNHKKEKILATVKEEKLAKQHIPECNGVGFDASCKQTDVLEHIESPVVSSQRATVICSEMTGSFNLLSNEKCMSSSVTTHFKATESTAINGIPNIIEPMSAKETSSSSPLPPSTTGVAGAVSIHVPTLTTSCQSESILSHTTSLGSPPSTIFSMSTSNTTLTTSPVSDTIFSLSSLMSSQNSLPSVVASPSLSQSVENITEYPVSESLIQITHPSPMSSFEVVTPAQNFTCHGLPEVREVNGSYLNPPLSNVSGLFTPTVIPVVTVVTHSVPLQFNPSLETPAVIQSSLSLSSSAQISANDHGKTIVNSNVPPASSLLSSRPQLLSDANSMFHSPCTNVNTSLLSTSTQMNMFSPIPIAHVTPSSYAFGIIATPTLLPHQNNYNFISPLLGVPEPTGYPSSHLNVPLGLTNGGIMHIRPPLLTPPPYNASNTVEQEICNAVPFSSCDSHVAQMRMVTKCSEDSQINTHQIHYGHQTNGTKPVCIYVTDPENTDDLRNHNSVLPNGSLRPKSHGDEDLVTRSVNVASDVHPIVSDASKPTVQTDHGHFNLATSPDPVRLSHLALDRSPDLKLSVSDGMVNTSSVHTFCEATPNHSEENSERWLRSNLDQLSNSCSSGKDSIGSSVREFENTSVQTEGNVKVDCVKQSDNNVMPSGIVISENKVHAGSIAMRSLNGFNNSNEQLKDSMSQTDYSVTTDKPNSPICHHSAFPGNIDIHVHPTINVPVAQNETATSKSHTTRCKQRGSRRVGPADCSTNSLDDSSFVSSSYSEDTPRSNKDRKTNRTVKSLNSKSNSSLIGEDNPLMVSMVERLIKSLQKELLGSDFSKVPVDRVVYNSLSRSRNGMNEMFSLRTSNDSSLSHSTKSVARSNKSMTSTGSKTSVVETVHSDSNALALLQVLKIVQNMSICGQDKKKKGRNGFKADDCHQLLQILNHFESKLSSQQLKDVKHDLHDLARNLKRQIKTNRIAVRDEIENRSNLFTSERFTKGTTTDLKVQEVSTDSGSNRTSGKRSNHIYRNKVAQDLTAVDRRGFLAKKDNYARTNYASTTSTVYTSSDISRGGKNRLVIEETSTYDNSNGLQHFSALALPDVKSKNITTYHPFAQMIHFMSEETMRSHMEKTPHNESVQNVDSGIRDVSTSCDNLRCLPKADDIGSAHKASQMYCLNGCSNPDTAQSSANAVNPERHSNASQKYNSYENENTDNLNRFRDNIKEIDVSPHAKPDLNNNNDTHCKSAEHGHRHCNQTLNQQNESNSNINSSIYQHEPNNAEDRKHAPLTIGFNENSQSSNVSPVSSITPQFPVMSLENMEIPIKSPEAVSAFTPIHPAPKTEISEEASHPVEDVSFDVQETSGSDVTDISIAAPEMETDSHHSFQMDREFDKHLADMKPHVLKLPHKADRQKCAVWIKKLCEPQGSSISARKTRNLYAQLMLQMLKKGTMSSPFDQKPSDGPLQPLPSYVSVYFDDPLNGFSQAERIPDWVEGELGDTIGSSVLPRSLGNPAATSTWVSGIADLTERPHSSMGHTLDKDPSLSPIRHTDKGRSKGYSVDDMSIEVKRSPSPPRHRPIKSLRSPDREKRQLPDVKVKGTRDEGSRPHHYQQQLQQQPPQHDYHDTEWNKPYNNNISMASSVSLPKGTTFYDDLPSYHKPTDREVAVRTKMIEAKFHEEKLKLQQKHDASVQKILDRKNAEIEDVKSHYRSKSKDMEDANSKLEKKAQTLLKEVEYVTQNKDKQIAEMKKLAEDSNDTRRNEFEKRLHDVMTEFEQEKFDMQKQHTQNIQEILDDTNSRLQRMETEYSHQTTTTTNVIKELESRVQQLMTEVDSTLNQRSAVEKEKNEALSRLEKLTEEYERLKEKSIQMERQHHVTTETQEHNLRSLKNKTEASLEFLKQENAIAASKAADTIKELEDKIEQLKKAVKETEEQRHRQIRELEQVHQQDKLHAENLHDKHVRNMKKEMEQQDADWGKKLSKAEKTIKEKEEDISKLKEQKQQQAVQSEQALEEFKLQVEKNQARIYDEMKQQMDQVESDLTKSKQAREKQVKEFTRQMEDIGFKHQHEIAEIKMNGEAEKSQLMREFHVQKEFIISEHDKEVDNLKDVHRTEVQALEARLKERQDKADKTSMDSERTIRELREELVQANQLRKQQLVELGLLREEEKQKVHRDHEAELARQRTELEQHRLEIQKSHSTEMEAVLEKTNERLKSIEKEYTDRGSKSAESIAELQNVVLQLRGDIKKSRENSDEKLAELKHQYEEEKQNLRKHYTQNLATIQKEVEAHRNRARNLERQLQTEDSDHEEKVTHLQLQYEERIRGLMSSDLKQELESTISSLKAQVSSLQQRSLMLQEELDAKNRNSLGPFGSRTSSPIKSSV